MATIEIHVPDELRRRMDDVVDEDWSQVARQAFEKRLEELPSVASARADGGERAAAGDGTTERLAANSAYDHGYAWARDRAMGRDLLAMVNAADYRRAADIVRGTKGFSQRDEFDDSAYPSDEMWEAFVDGATARYNESAE